MSGCEFLKGDGGQQTLRRPSSNPFGPGAVRDKAGAATGATAGAGEGGDPLDNGGLYWATMHQILRDRMEVLQSEVERLKRVNKTLERDKTRLQQELAIASMHAGRKMNTGVGCDPWVEMTQPTAYGMQLR